MKRLAGALFCLLYLSIYAEAANRFAVCTTACTWDGSSTLMWSTTSGGATGASVPGSSDAVVLDASTCVGGVTCTITVNTTVTVQAITMGACTASTTGCVLDFSANNNNVTLTANPGFSGTGTGTRTLNMGNGIWTLSSATGTWTTATTTNLTFNANSSTISLTGAPALSQSRTFTGGGLSYNIITVGAAVGGTAFSGANTIATLNITAPNYIFFPSGVTTTITSAFTWSGSTVGQNFIGTSSNSASATVSVASGLPTMSWAALRGMTFSGGATFTATSSFDLGTNTGITITPPSSGGGGRIIGGWLLNRDLDAANDNYPAWIRKAA